MLTPDQIKNLKPGDTLVYTTHLKFREYDSENDELLLEDSHGDPDYYRVEEVALLNSQSSIVNRQSKYDPCRRFKKGDKVEIIDWNGRNPIEDDFPFGVYGTIVEDEDLNSESFGVLVYSSDAGNGGVTREYPPCFLRLVTPVEELEPYRVVDDGSFYYIDKEDEAHALCTFNKLSHPHAKEAAEAERDRLNAEYRKEQNEKILP